MYTYKYTTIMFFFCQSSPCLHLCFILPPLHDPTLLFTYLEIPLLLLVVRITIHSCPWLAINCSPLATSPTPRHPTDQVTYLHRQHQKHQLIRLIQVHIFNLQLTATCPSYIGAHIKPTDNTCSSPSHIQ
jgi:hypothetical protein